MYTDERQSVNKLSVMLDIGDGVDTHMACCNTQSLDLQLRFTATRAPTQPEPIGKISTVFLTR